MRSVFSLNTELFKVTGVQKVLVDIHNAIKDDFCSKIVGDISYERVDAALNISKDDYLKFKNPFMFRRSIVIIHERKLLILFWLLNTFFFQQIKIIYVHHNMLYGHKFSSKMPNHIVGISDNCIENLRSYFGVPANHIHKIYNCVVDHTPTKHRVPQNSTIKILYPARINDQKQQIEIVRRLQGKLNKNIKILFAGDGPDYQELNKMVQNDENFECLGFRDNIPNLLQDCEFMMLFSKHEGLPLTLIEACMCGCPIICSDVGGNSEICINGENGWVVESWESLLNVLNSLPFVSKEEYESMSLKGRSHYESNFNFEIFKNNYIELLKIVSNE